MRRRPSSTDAITVAAVILMAVLSGCRTTQALDPIGIQDAQLAAQVKSALINDPEVGTSPIEVSVVRGVARLTGTVATPAIAQRAAQLARSFQGLRNFQPSLQFGVTTVKPAADTAAPRQSTAIPEAFETEENPGFLAVGASLGWSRPRVNALGEHVSVSPLVRFGSGRGFGPAIAFNWFRTSLAGEPRRQGVIS